MASSSIAHPKDALSEDSLLIRDKVYNNSLTYLNLTIHIVG